jgi:hypothetical protein
MRFREFERTGDLLVAGQVTDQAFFGISAITHLAWSTPFRRMHSSNPTVKIHFKAQKVPALSGRGILLITVFWAL